MPQSNHSFKHREPFSYAAITFLGSMAVILGLVLIIFVHYHERAYVFLGLGAGCIMGGIAGIVWTGWRLKAALSHALIAMGMVGFIVGLNYLTSKYGPLPNLTHGAIVITLSGVAIVAGITAALIARPESGLVIFAGVFMLGVIASIGLVLLIVGTIYLVVLQHQVYAFLLLGAGAICITGGIACGIFVQRRSLR